MHESLMGTIGIPRNLNFDVPVPIDVCVSLTQCVFQLLQNEENKRPNINLNDAAFKR